MWIAKRTELSLGRNTRRRRRFVRKVTGIPRGPFDPIGRLISPIPSVTKRIIAMATNIPRRRNYLPTVLRSPINSGRKFSPCSNRMPFPAGTVVSRSQHCWTLISPSWTTATRKPTSISCDNWSIAKIIISHRKHTRIPNWNTRWCWNTMLTSLAKWKRSPSMLERRTALHRAIIIDRNARTWPCPIRISILLVTSMIPSWHCSDERTSKTFTLIVQYISLSLSLSLSV